MDQIKQEIQQTRADFEAFKAQVQAEKTVEKLKRKNRSMEALIFFLRKDLSDDLERNTTLIINEMKHRPLTLEQAKFFCTSLPGINLEEIGDKLIQEAADRKKQELATAAKKKKKMANKPLLRDSGKGALDCRNLKNELYDF